MNTPSTTLITKLSVPGNDASELCYVFSEDFPHFEGNESLSVFGIFHTLSSGDLYANMVGTVVRSLSDFCRLSTSRSLLTTLKRGSTDADALSGLFEKSLQHTAEECKTYLAEQGVRGEKFEKRRVSAIIGLVYKGEIVVTVIGRTLRGYLIHPVMRDNNFVQYTASTIVDENSDEDPGSKRLFSNIINGSLTIPGSTIVLCNKSVLDFFSVDSLKQILASYPFSNVVPFLTGKLSQANTEADFNALFIHFPGRNNESEAMPAKHQQTVSDSSMNSLVGRQRATDRVLSPAAAKAMFSRFSSFAQDSARHLGDRFRRAPRFAKPSTPATPPSAVSPTKLKSSDAAPIISFTTFRVDRIVQIIKTGAGNVSFFYTKTVSNMKKSAKKGGGKKVFADAVATLPKPKELGVRTQAYVREKIMTLSPISKSLLVIALVFLVLFTVSVVSTGKKNADKKKVDTFIAQANDIEKKATEAEAGLIYGDEDRARSMLEQAKKDLELLPRTNGDQNTRYAQLKDKIIAAENVINRVVVVKTPGVIARLDTQVPTTSGLRLSGLEDTLLVYGADGIYKVDKKAGKLSQINTQAKIPSIQCVVDYTASIIYVCDNDRTRIFSIDLKDDTIKQVGMKFPSDSLSWSGAGFFGTRLYTLDGATGEIYRSALSGGKFAAATAWMKPNKGEFKNALSFAIDGTMYALRNGGEILQANQGKVTPFKIPTIEPALQNAQSIWTDSDAKYMYILEPAQQRALIIDKATGLLKTQLKSDVLANATSIIVNEKKREMIVLSGATIYTLPLDAK